MPRAFGDHRTHRDNCGHLTIGGIATDGRELLGDRVVRRRRRPHAYRPSNPCSTAGRQQFRFFGNEHRHRDRVEQDLSNDLHVGTATHRDDGVDADAPRTDGVEHIDCHRDGSVHRVADELVESAAPQCRATADERSENRDAAQERQLVFTDSDVVDEPSPGLDRQCLRCPERGDEVIAQDTIAGITTQFIGARRGEYPAAVDIHHGHRRAGRTDVEQRDAALPGQYTRFPERTQLGTELRDEHNVVGEILVEGRSGVAFAKRENRVEVSGRMLGCQIVHRGDDGIPGIGCKTVGRRP